MSSRDGAPRREGGLGVLARTQQGPGPESLSLGRKEKNEKGNRSVAFYHNAITVWHGHPGNPAQRQGRLNNTRLLLSRAPLSHLSRLSPRDPPGVSPSPWNPANRIPLRPCQKPHGPVPRLPALPTSWLGLSCDRGDEGGAGNTLTYCCAAGRPSGLLLRQGVAGAAGHGLLGEAIGERLGSRVASAAVSGQDRDMLHDWSGIWRWERGGIARRHLAKRDPFSAGRFPWLRGAMWPRLSPPCKSTHIPPCRPIARGSLSRNQTCRACGGEEYSANTCRSGIDPCSGRTEKRERPSETWGAKTQFRSAP
ncbi:hypothetical protein VUR80DRAFT_9183 [Thermomyces stellatus]